MLRLRLTGWSREILASGLVVEAVVLLITTEYSPGPAR
jgi:hypothetical protein